MSDRHDRDDRSAAPAEDREPARAPAPADDTRVLAPADGTRVLAPADGTRVLAPADGTRVLAPADDTWVLDSADGRTSTLHLGPADGHTPGDEPGPADAEYSATVLASHWILRPEPDTTLVEPTSTQIPPTPTPTPTPPTRPDRTEGTVLRFGPGVTTAVADRVHRTLPTVPPPPAPPRRRLRRHALPALVLVCVIAFLAWQRLGPSVAVRTVALTARPAVLGCDDTADMVALVTTDGRPGTLSYRWTRSDGTASGVLREVVVRGQRQARLHLLWTFQGKGDYTARAELRILSPAHRTVTTRLTYACH
ncbi:hypothetical protein [Streptomyces sp. ALI-76-A]|uniref:hypothetical protein n=1 Tax=Streptomyces sp. ALI-76-A TaxID=3025736 RepID=UPI00256EA02E|nr:hypothetical protein [Streptomyces sp. ALI-76-A]MDL5202771.1 hypothetical protein [Streptomyces sp. ALI-76-A]